MTFTKERIQEITELMDDTRMKSLLALSHEHGRLLRRFDVRLNLDQATEVAAHLDKTYATAVNDVLALITKVSANNG